MQADKPDSFKSFRRQLTMVLIGCLGMMIAGCVNGWSAPALVKLQSGKEIFTIDKAVASSLALYSEIGHFLLPVPIGILADRLGRKPTFIITSAFALVGWGILTFGKTLTYFAIARVVMGFAFGSQCVIVTIYIAEISSINVRGMFGSTSMFSLNVGILFQFIIGGNFTVTQTATITFALCIVHMILVFFIVESPYFLVAVNRTEKAEKNLMWLRAAPATHTFDEYSSILKRTQVTRNVSSSVRNLFSKANFKGFSYCMILSFLAECTGRVATITYALENFKKVDPSMAERMTILLGVTNIIFMMVPMLLVDKIGRKIMIVVSGIGAAVMHLISGFIYFLLTKMGSESPLFQWLIFGSLAGFQIFSSIYLTNILTVRGEIISENSRGFASGFSSMAFAVGVVVSTKTFQITRDSLGIYFAFWSLAVFSVFMVVFTCIFIPETKNKSFEAIQLNMYGNRSVPKHEENETNK